MPSIGAGIRCNFKPHCREQSPWPQEELGLPLFSGHCGYSAALRSILDTTSERHCEASQGGGAVGNHAAQVWAYHEHLTEPREEEGAAGPSFPDTWSWEKQVDLSLLGMCPPLVEAETQLDLEKNVFPAGGCTYTDITSNTSQTLDRLWAFLAPNIITL